MTEQEARTSAAQQSSQWSGWGDQYGCYEIFVYEIGGKFYTSVSRHKNVNIITSYYDGKERN